MTAVSRGKTLSDCTAASIQSHQTDGTVGVTTLNCLHRYCEYSISSSSSSTNKAIVDAITDFTPVRNLLPFYTTTE